MRGSKGRGSKGRGSKGVRSHYMIESWAELESKYYLYKSVKTYCTSI